METPTTPESLVGRTVHVLNRTKYAGAWNVSTAEAIDGYPGWATIVDADRGMRWNVLIADCFDTEAEARDAARARRQPRRTRQPVALYGDFAQLAAMNGISTDGTGRSSRSNL